MQHKIHENGWTVIIEDWDMRTATQDDINQISRWLATNTLVIVKKQNLSVEDEVRLIKMFKTPRQFYPESNLDDEGYANCIVPNSDNILVRVTGELDENGNPGFAGDIDELVWHCNDPTRQERHPLVWLYAVKGSKGSKTTWNNNIYTYEALDKTTQEKLKDLKLVIKHLNTEDELGRFNPNLVHTNIAGKTGLFFPFLQVKGILNMSEEESLEVMNPLIEHTTKEEYLYHLEWEDGDLSISEQWLGIHKRWTFEGMPSRVLHRAVFEFPDQNYKS
jgi:alpha-ketoglutarate-dependent taurine dioxygenase